jgi:O-antigen/teichoic acid export membrane protein
MKNSLYNLIGAGIRLSIGLLTIPVLIQTLGIQEYGLWTLVSSAIAIVTLVEGGISMSTTVFLARDLADSNEEGLSQTLTVVSCTMIFLAGFASLFMWLGAEPIVSYFPNLTTQQNLTAISALKFGAFALFAKLLQQTMVGIEQAYQKYGLMNLVNTLQSSSTNLGLLGIAYLGGRSTELMEWTAGISTIGLIVHSIVAWRLLKSFKIRFRWDKVKSQQIAKYSAFTWLSQLGGTMFSQGDRLIVGGILGIESLGVYAAITNITYQINYLSGLVVQPLLPAIATSYQQQLADRKDPETLIATIKRGCQFNTAIALGTGIVMLSFAPFIGKLVIGKYFTSSHILPFELAIIIYSIYSLNASGYFTLIAIDLVNICTIAQLISGGCSLLLMYFGALQFGLIGAVIGNIGFILTLVLNSVATDKIVKQKFLWLKWIYFPFGVFIASIAIDSLVDRQNIILNLLLLAIELSVFGTYFYLELKPKPKSRL